MGSGRSALTAVQQFTNVVATGLRPVGLGAAFHTKEDGSQGPWLQRGNSFLLASISLATAGPLGWGLSPEPQAQA